MFGSDQQDFYQGMFDDQLSVELTKGKGLGLADMLVRQLMQGAGWSRPCLIRPGPALRAGATAPRRQSADAHVISCIAAAPTAAARELGVDPDIVVAHAALETGWGRSSPPDDEPTLFGIKAGCQTWRGASRRRPNTREYAGGVAHAR